MKTESNCYSQFFFAFSFLFNGYQPISWGHTKVGHIYQTLSRKPISQLLN